MIYPRESNPSTYVHDGIKCDSCDAVVNFVYGYIEMIDDTLVDIHVCSECMLKYEKEIDERGKERKKEKELF